MEIIPTPPEKIQTLPKASHAPLRKKLNPSRKNLNFPEKFPLPKNSITISETIYQTLKLNLNPFPKNPYPCEKFSIPPGKISTPYPLKIFSTLLENVLTPPKNFTCNHPENLSKPLNNSQPPRNIS